MNFQARSLIDEHRFSEGIKILLENLAHLRSSGDSEMRNVCVLILCRCIGHVSAPTP